MAKTLNLGIGQAALIDGEFVGKVISAEYADATPTETVAVEIDNVTEQPAIVIESDRWMKYFDGSPVFTFDKRLLEYFA